MMAYEPVKAASGLLPAIAVWLRWRRWSNGQGELPAIRPVKMMERRPCG